MSAPNGEFFEQMLSDLTRKREELAEMRNRMGEVSSTVTAPRQVVTITVGSHGEVTDLKFPTGAYKRMAPAELASVIMKTIEDARTKALKQSAELLAPTLPAGFDAEGLLSGKVTSLQDIMPSLGLDAMEKFVARDGDLS